MRLAVNLVKKFDGDHLIQIFKDLIFIQGSGFVSPLQIGVPDCIMGGHKIRIRPNGLFIGFHFVLAAAEFAVNHTQVEVGFGKVRLDVDGFLIGLDRFCILAESGAGNRNVIMRGCRLRIDAGGILKCFLALLKAASVQVNDSQIKIRFFKFRVDRDDLLECFERFIVMTDFVQVISEMEMGKRICRIRLNRLFVCRDGLGVGILAGVAIAQTIPGR